MGVFKPVSAELSYLIKLAKFSKFQIGLNRVFMLGCCDQSKIG